MIKQYPLFLCDKKKHTWLNMFFRLIFCSVYIIYVGLTLPRCREQEYLAQGLCCPKCPPGKKIFKDCTEQMVTNCTICTYGTFQEGLNQQRQCVSTCTKCDAGLGLKVKKSCTLTSDALCETLDGFFCSDSNGGGCRAAQRHTVCSPGRYIGQRGTADKDTECLHCTEGTFSDGASSSCLSHRKCESVGLELMKPGTDSTDSECGEHGSHKGLVAGIIPGVILVVASMALIIIAIIQRKKIRGLFFRRHVEKKGINNTDYELGGAAGEETSDLSSTPLLSGPSSTPLLSGPSSSPLLPPELVKIHPALHPQIQPYSPRSSPTAPHPALQLPPVKHSLLKIFLIFIWFSPLHISNIVAVNLPSCDREQEYIVRDFCCPKCPPGKKISKDCTEQMITTCTICTNGTFQEGLNQQRQCVSTCTKCDTGLGLKVKKSCSSTSDALCEPLDGFFCSDSNRGGCRAAQRHTVCSPGRYIGQRGTADKDTECLHCTDGTFSNGASLSCQPHTKCESVGLKLMKPGTDSTDSECGEHGPDTLKAVISGSLLKEPSPCCLWVSVATSCLIMMSD